MVAKIIPRWGWGFWVGGEGFTHYFLQGGLPIRAGCRIEEEDVIFTVTKIDQCSDQMTSNFVERTWSKRSTRWSCGTPRQQSCCPKSPSTAILWRSSSAWWFAVRLTCPFTSARSLVPQSPPRGCSKSRDVFLTLHQYKMSWRLKDL